MNALLYAIVSHIYSFHLDKYLEVGLLGHRIYSWFIFRRWRQIVFQSGAINFHSYQEGSCCSASLQIFGIISLMNFSYSGRVYNGNCYQGLVCRRVFCSSPAEECCCLLLSAKVTMGWERFPTSSLEAGDCVSTPSADSGSLPGPWKWEGCLPFH